MARKLHVERTKDSDSAKRLEARSHGLQLRISGSVSTLNLGWEGSTLLRWPSLAVRSALFNGVDHASSSEETKAKEELFH